MRVISMFRFVMVLCAWLASSTFAFAQDQFSIRCMTREPNDQQRGRIDEQVRRHRAVLQDLRVDLCLLVLVHAESGEVLQSQVPIAVDLGIGQPGLELRSLCGKRRQQVDTVVEADLGE